MFVIRMQVYPRQKNSFLSLLLLLIRNYLPITLAIRDIMEGNVVTASPGDSVLSGLSKMIEKKVWSLLIERSGLPVGVVTERDILRRCISKRFSPETMKLEEIMSSPIVTIDQNSTLADAMRVIVDKSVRRLFVVDNGKIVGRVTQTGLFSSLLDLMMRLSSTSL